MVGRPPSTNGLVERRLSTIAMLLSMRPLRKASTAGSPAGLASVRRDHPARLFRAMSRPSAGEAIDKCQRLTRSAAHAIARERVTPHEADATHVGTMEEATCRV